MKSTYSKLLILSFHILSFPWFCALFDFPSQIPIRTMFPRYYTFLNFTPYLGGPPQKCKIEVLLHLFRLVLSDVSLILCSCKIKYVSRKCFIHVHAHTRMCLIFKLFYSLERYNGFLNYRSYLVTDSRKWYSNLFRTSIWQSGAMTWLQKQVLMLKFQWLWHLWNCLYYSVWNTYKRWVLSYLPSKMYLDPSAVGSFYRNMDFFCMNQ